MKISGDETMTDKNEKENFLTSIITWGLALILYTWIMHDLKKELNPAILEDYEKTKRYIIAGSITFTILFIILGMKMGFL